MKKPQPFEIFEPMTSLIWLDTVDTVEILSIKEQSQEEQFPHSKEITIIHQKIQKLHQYKGQTK